MDAFKKYLLKNVNSFYTLSFSMCIMMWGFYLLLPFARLTAPIHISHYVLGSIAFILGTTQIFLSRRMLGLSLWPMAGQFMFWIFIGVNGVIAGYRTPGLILYAFLAIMCGIAYVHGKFLDL